MTANLKTYNWIGFSKDGHRLKGKMLSHDKQGVIANLKTQNLYPYKITLEAKHLWFGSQNLSCPLFTSKINAHDINNFTHELALLIKSGIPILEGLEIMKKTASKQPLKEILQTIKNSLAGGEMLSTALKKLPQHFDNLYCHLVNIGEKSGTLDVMLESIAANQKKLFLQKARLKKAILYPAIVASISIIVTYLLLVFVIPRFEDMFSSFNARLPLYTRIVLIIARGAKKFSLLIGSIFIMIITAFHLLYKKKPSFCFKIDRALLLKTPFIKVVTCNAATARFARILAVTLSAALPILEGLELTAEIFKNTFYRQSVLKAKKELAKGQMLSAALAKQNFFPLRAINMIAIGEETGALDTMLYQVAEFYENELNSIIDNLNIILEPLIMIILGILVGGLIIAMYLPIFSLGKLI